MSFPCLFIYIINFNSFITAFISKISFVPIEMNKIRIILEISTVFKSVFLSELCEFFY